MLNIVYFQAKINKQTFAGKLYIEAKTKKEASDIAKKHFKLKNIRVTTKIKQLDLKDYL